MADHKSLKPWRLIEIRGADRDILARALNKADGKKGHSSKPRRAPLIIAEAPLSTSAPSDAAGVVAPTVPTPTSAPEAPIVGEVRIAAGENPGSWLSIKQDGVEVFAKTLSQGQSFALRAQRAVLIKAGNSGVVTVIINGKELCCAGSRNGEVRTVSWPP